ncbi:cache domain-containing protein [Chloroflexota bacterium]
MTIKSKLPTTFLIALLVAVIVLSSLIIVFQGQIGESDEEARLESLNNVFVAKIEDTGRMATAMATAFAEIPEVQSAFADKDRDALIELLHASYLALDDQFDIPQSQFHLEPATSFLRLHELTKHGDDLSDFRNTVLAANSEQAPIAGLEKGKGGYGIRGVVPCFHEGTHIGSFEMGMSFDETFLDDIKANFNADLSVYMRDDISKVETFDEETQAPAAGFSLYASTMVQPLDIKEDVHSRVFDSGESEVTNSNITAPIKDYNGDIIGVVDINLESDDDLNGIASSRNAAVAAGALAFLALCIAVWQVISRRDI